MLMTQLARQMECAHQRIRTAVAGESKDTSSSACEGYQEPYKRQFRYKPSKVARRHERLDTCFRTKRPQSGRDGSDRNDLVTSLKLCGRETRFPHLGNLARKNPESGNATRKAFE